jgi:glycosyltransferase involved in cell wall biosynthesis
MIARVSDRGPRRVGLLIESDGPGGAEQVVAHLARALVERGHEVVVFVPQDGEGWLSAQLSPTGITVAALPLGGPLGPRGIAAVIGALGRHRIDLLHTHEFGQALPGAIAARVHGIPHLITLHGGNYFAERWRRRAALRVAVALSGAVTAVSDQLARRVAMAIGRPDSAVIRSPNGAAPVPAGDHDVRGALGVPEGAPFMVAVGNLYPVKGHRFLLDALALLRPRHPDLHLAIAGRGELATTLAAHAGRHAITDRVHFLGLRSDIGTLLRAADLFVHPSTAEGLPLAVLEAMFACRPVVASAVGEIPAVLADGDAGVLVPAGDPPALAQAIDRVLTDPAHACALATRAATRAATEYGIGRMVARYETLYTRLADA